MEKPALRGRCSDRKRLEISRLFYAVQTLRRVELPDCQTGFELIVSRLNRAARRKLKLKKELLAIDSTTITVGKNRLPWALYHCERSGIKLHVSFTNSTGMPLQVVETTGLKHDGPIGVELEDKRFIIVADRAYFSIDKADRYVATKQDFVIRLKENI